MYYSIHSVNGVFDLLFKYLDVRTRLPFLHSKTASGNKKAQGAFISYVTTVFVLAERTGGEMSMNGPYGPQIRPVRHMTVT